MDKIKFILRKCVARGRVLWQKGGFVITLSACLVMLGGAMLLARGRAVPAPIAQPSPPPLAVAQSLDQRLSDTTSDPVLSWPVASREILVSHSPDQPVWSDTLRQYAVHTGLDIACARGEAVTAALDGTVTAAERDPLLGNIVTITHDKNARTRYGNLSSLNLVEIGQHVKLGDLLGAVGESAAAESAMTAHLHFEAYIDGRWLALTM